MWRRRGTYVDVAMGDGTWHSVEEGSVMPEGAGIEIPGDVFEAVFQAFLEYKGFKTHDPTEVKVLREWLELEKGRVDTLMTRTMNIVNKVVE